MATGLTKTIRKVEHDGAELSDHLFDQLATLRKEIAILAESVGDYGGHALHDVQHNAAAFAREAQRQLPVVAKQVRRQAKKTGRAIQADPLPVIVILGTLALVTTLLYTRD